MMPLIFKDYLAIPKAWSVSDEEGIFAIILPNPLTNIYEFFQDEDDIYLTIEELEEIVQFMKENCK